MNTRPVVLVCLLIVLIITSQFEWKQQIEDAADAEPATARRRQQVLAKEDAVKEKDTHSLPPLSFGAASAPLAVAIWPCSPPLSRYPTSHASPQPRACFPPFGGAFDLKVFDDFPEDGADD